MSKRIKTTVHQNSSVEQNDVMTSKKGSVIFQKLCMLEVHDEQMCEIFEFW